MARVRDDGWLGFLVGLEFLEMADEDDDFFFFGLGFLEIWLRR